MRPVAIRIGRLSWLPRFLPLIVRLDLFIRKLSRRRISLLSFAGLPELFLTVPGRKTGVPRTTPLLCAPHEDGWVIAGSNWGQPKPPIWVLNLEAADEAHVEFKGKDYTVVPKLTAGEERAELWEVLRATWPNFDLYASRAEREIKVFRLTRV